MNTYYFYYWNVCPLTLQRKMYHEKTSLKPSILRITENNIINAVKQYELTNHLDFLHCFFDEKTSCFYHVSRNEKTKDLLFQYYFHFLSDFLKTTL